MRNPQNFETYFDVEMSYSEMSTESHLPATRIWLVLAKAYGSISEYIERSMGANGFCLKDFMVLEVLLHKGPLPISVIGEKVLLASASMTSAIDRLEKRDLVARTEIKGDRRLRVVRLTAAGRALIRTMYAQHEHDLEKIGAGLSEAERRGLHTGLKKLGLAAKLAVASEKTDLGREDEAVA